MSVTFRLQTDDADYCQSRGQNLLYSSSSTLPIIKRIQNMAMGKSPSILTLYVYLYYNY